MTLCAAIPHFLHEPESGIEVGEWAEYLHRFVICAGVYIMQNTLIVGREVAATGKKNERVGENEKRGRIIGKIV